MAKIDMLNIQGEKIKTIELSDSIFSITPHKQAMFDAITMQRASLRQGTHKVKNRSEVRGGGAKPWKQKGTGRARQGSIRSPQWKGGGVVFGPTPRSYSKSINRKVARLALISTIAEKFQNNNLIVIDQIEMAKPSTKEMVKVMHNLKADRKPMLVTDEFIENIFLSTRNIPGAINLDVLGINVLDIANAHKLILTEKALNRLEEVYNAK